MLKIKAIIATSYLLLSSGVSAMQDLYTGTISLEGDKLILTRCDVAKSQYTLTDTEGENTSLIKQLPEQIKDKSKKVSIGVLAEYQDNNGENVLLVNKFNYAKIGSCHLSDLFD